MMGTTKLVLVGDGEPLLHPRFLDMVSLGKELGFHITVITNGTLLDDTTIQALIDSRLDILHVSLWTGSVEGYQQQYPGTNPDYFHKVIEAMEKVVKQKRAQNADLPLLRLHHPINRHNFQDIDSVADLAMSIGCNLLSLSPFLTFKGQYIECALAQDQERAVYDSLRQLRNRLNSTPMNHNIDETMLRYRLGPAVWKQIPCYAGWFYTRIGTDGRVFPCCRCEGSLGDLHQNSFSEIWNNSAYRAFRMQAMTPRGLAALQNDCDCEYCCHISANLKVHRVCRWLSPFIRSSDK